MLTKIRTRLSELIAPPKETKPEPKTLVDWYEYMEDQPVIEI